MENKKTENNDKFELRNSLLDYFKFGAVGNYFLRLFGKNSPDKPKNTNLVLMHGINRISVVVFLVAIIILLIRHVF